MKKIAVTGLAMANALGSSASQCFSAICQGHSGIQPLQNHISGLQSGALASTHPSQYQLISQTLLSSNLQHPNFGLYIQISGQQNSILQATDPAQLATKLNLPYFQTFISSFGSLNSLASAFHSITQKRTKGAIVLATSFIKKSNWEYFGYLNTTDNRDFQMSVRPYDQTAKGTILGQGSSVLILQQPEFAKARGAQIFCYISGISRKNDYKYTIQPDQQGNFLAKTVQSALEQAGIESVDCVFGSGCGILSRDRAEIMGLTQVVKKKTPLTSSVWATGHQLSGQGISQVVFAALSLKEVICKQGKIFENGVNQMPILVEGKQTMLQCVNGLVEKEMRSILVSYTGLFGANFAVVFVK